MGKVNSASEYHEDVTIRLRALKDTGSSLNEEDTPSSCKENANSRNIASQARMELPYLSDCKVVNAMSRTNSQHQLKRLSAHKVVPD